MKIKKQFATKTQEVQIWIVTPHLFVKKNQGQLLPDWNVSVNLLILVLQKSRVSLRKSDESVVREKDRLRVKFIRFGWELSSALRDRGYLSDIFDPRNGYPLLSQQGKSRIDDNATVATLLDYPTIAYQNCSLIQHPDWGDLVYPSTIATSASIPVVELLVEKFLVSM